MKKASELYLKVRAYQAENIIDYLAEHESIALDEARERWDEMLKFLVLCVAGQGTHAPSSLVDTSWHAFVLHTERYEAFCLEYLGRFIHHRPISNPVAEFRNSLSEVFTSFPDSPVRKHMWLPAKATSDLDLTMVGDCEDGGTDCIAKCAEVGCHKNLARRRSPLLGITAYSAA